MGKHSDVLADVSHSDVPAGKTDLVKVDTAREAPADVA